MYVQQSDWDKRELHNRVYMEVINVKFLMFSDAEEDRIK